VTVLEAALMPALVSRTVLASWAESVPPAPCARRFLSAPGTRMAMWLA
jgi:hypothetical protein